MGGLCLRGEEAGSASGILRRHGLDDPQVDGEGNEMLLRSIMDVSSTRRRSLSWAAIRRSRDSCSSPARAASSSRRAASSARNPTSRSTRPACAASPVNRRSSTDESGTPSRSCSRQIP